MSAEALFVFTVAERPGQRPVWVRIGQATQRPDGSLTLHLDAIPLSGRLEVCTLERAKHSDTTPVRSAYGGLQVGHTVLTVCDIISEKCRVGAKASVVSLWEADRISVRWEDGGLSAPITTSYFRRLEVP